MKKCVFLVFLLILTLPLVESTSPSLPPCVEVDNPEFYAQEAMKTNFHNTIIDKGWKLDSYEVPCTYGDMNIIMIYDLPLSVSSYGILYKSVLYFNLEDDKLSNERHLMQIIEDYDQRIKKFESSPGVSFFILNGNIKDAVYSGNLPRIITLDSEGYGHLFYDFIYEKIEGFYFENPNLVNNVDLFIEGIKDVPQIKEFYEKSGVLSVSFGGNQVTFVGDENCETINKYRNDCGNYLEYDTQGSFSGVNAFTLDHRLNWENFDEITESHNIIKRDLLVNNPKCRISDLNPYTDMQKIIDGRKNIEVQLTCTDYEVRSTAVLTLLPDGSYKDLNLMRHVDVNSDYTPLWFVLILIFLSAVFFVVKDFINKNNAPEKNPKKWYKKWYWWVLIFILLLILAFLGLLLLLDVILH